MNGTQVTPTWEIVREMLDRFQARTGLGIEWVAGELSRRLGKEVQSRTVYRYQEANGLVIHHETLVILSEIIDEPAALNDFAHRLNRAVITLPEINPPKRHDVPALIRAIKETTEGIEASAEALQSGTVTNQAWVKAHREIMEGVEELLMLNAVVQGQWERDKNEAEAA